MAKPGYGKRSAPDQAAPRADDFAHLPPREAYLAGFLDRLSDNAAMDAKTVAKAQPLYGQQAVRSALNELSRHGHLRRVRRRAQPGETGVDNVTRWVFHTYWSRTARSNDWWARFLAGDEPVADEVADVRPQTAPGDVPPQAETEAEPPPNPPARPHPAPAYTALARLGLHDPRLALSASDCEALQALAEEWLARGATPVHLTRSLVAGLPDQVHSPRAFVQHRLRDKMPPELPAAPTAPTDPAPPASPGPRRLMECTDCGVPGRPEALPGGLCRGCRGEGIQRARGGEGSDGNAVTPVTPVTPERLLSPLTRPAATPDTVRALAGQLRSAVRASRAGLCRSPGDQVGSPS
ncbi:hypothetical protein AQJ67_25335 [Streptomyces caeruleatus]|uniref:Uncharacterized protein n=2 Tax=Streptomyces caeruleatus TaxID=661399 RepID=A0A101TWA0_9ACTN|nr:hypothetical protein AQJ67_25335 [Streptomyces caeruleatus]